MTNDDKKKRRRGLGRGLGALLPQSDISQTTEEASRSFAYISIEDIVPAEDQPRKLFDQTALEELAASIVESGLIQPLVVRKKGGVYELIAGERRWRACKIAELNEIPVVIKELSDEVAFTLALVENVQREDLSPLEQASAFQRLIDEFGYTQQRVAESVGKSRSAIANSLRLLRLPNRILELIEQEELSAGHARTLVTLPDDEAIELAEIIVRHGYSVREAEEMARDYNEHGLWLSRSPAPAAPPSQILPISVNETEVIEEREDSRASEEVLPEVEVASGGSQIIEKTSFRDNPQIRFITERLAEALGTKVVIQDRGGKGRVVVHYEDLEILQDVLERILGKGLNE